MARRSSTHRRELVAPNREKLRALRDQYMRDMDATSYDEVREKFLQELSSKRAQGQPRGRERGAGLWNSAFAQKGLMLRSSIVLLAEFFGVEPEELIQAPGPERTARSAAEEVPEPEHRAPTEPAAEGSRGKVSKTSLPTGHGLVLPDEQSLERCLVEKELNTFAALRWNSGLVPWINARDRHLDDVLAWAESTEGPSWQLYVLTGSGGSGKTRLAAEVARRVRSIGWAAGFLPRVHDLDFSTQATPVLAILDYPEEQQDLVRALLERLKNQDSSWLPARFVLLSRQLPREWESAVLSLGGAARFGSLTRLAPLDESDGLEVLFQAASRAARVLRHSLDWNDAAARQWLRGAEDATVSPRFIEQRRQPLYLAAAGLHAAIAPQSAFTLTSEQVVQSLVTWEFERAARASVALGCGRATLPRLIALACTAGSLPDVALRQLAVRGGLWSEAFPGDLRDRVATTSWYSDKISAIPAVGPDVLAAALVELVLSDATGDFVEWLRVALEPELKMISELSWKARELLAVGGNFVERLSRLIYDVKEVFPGREPALSKALKAMASTPDALKTLSFLARVRSSVELRPVEAMVTSRQAELESDPYKRAFLLNAAAHRAIDEGDKDRAAKTKREALDILSAIHSPDEHEIALLRLTRAEWLHHRANNETLSADELHALLREIMEELNIWRSHKHASGYLLLAQASAEIANKLGNREEARATYEVLVGELRELASEEPEYGRMFVQLANLNAIYAFQAGDKDQARLLVREAFDTSLKYLSIGDRAFAVHTARSAYSYALLLIESGDREHYSDAMLMVRQALSMFKEFMSIDPKRFVSAYNDIADSGVNLANGLGDRKAAEEFQGMMQPTGSPQEYSGQPAPGRRHAEDP